MNDKIGTAYRVCGKGEQEMCKKLWLESLNKRNQSKDWGIDKIIILDGS